MNHAWNGESFRNFMSYGREWLDDGGFDDCNARSYESLVDVARSGLPADLRQWACDLGSPDHAKGRGLDQSAVARRHDQGSGPRLRRLR